MAFCKRQQLPFGLLQLPSGLCRLLVEKMKLPGRAMDLHVFFQIGGR